MNRVPELYHQTILDHNRDPSNFSKELSGEHRVKAVNTYCGDKYDLAFNLNEHISQVTFFGYGCAVSKAAASLLTEAMQSQTVRSLRDRCAQYLAFLDGKAPSPAFDPRLEAFAAVMHHPGREQCATLVWQSMLKKCNQLLRESDSA